MRLIDADAISYTMLYKEDWLRGTGVEKPAAWKDTIDAMPTIEVEPIKRGKWINENNVLICSQCGFRLIGARPHYCQKCGAKMEEEE